MKKIIILIVSHGIVAFVGFGAGIYVLPILSAPPAPTASDLAALASSSEYSGEFRRDLEDSDALHWGEGTVYVSRRSISLEGNIAPGPAYKLYLSPEFVQTETAFMQAKSAMAQVGDVKTFKNFVVPVPESVDPAAYNTIVIWCESFSQFITAAQYR